MLLHDARKVDIYDTEPERIQLQIQLISQWLKENPNVNANSDFENLLFFLRSCKYDLERTKKKIKK